MRCWVRRSFEAATISMAAVIFCVLRTLAIFVRISLPLLVPHNFKVLSLEKSGFPGSTAADDSNDLVLFYLQIDIV